jgi:hypothetical protein
MILRAKDGIRGRLFDLDTGKEVPKVTWVNLETGQLEAYVVDAAGNIQKWANGENKIYWATGKFKFVPAQSALVSKPPEIDPDPPPPRKTKYDRIVVPMLSDRCEAYACNRVADWAVSDEIALPPLIKDGKRYARAKVVDRHWWCDKHFKPPRILDEKGDVVEELNNEARPQW